MTNPHVAALYRYPLKGFSAEQMDAVDLSPGQTLPFDRAYAIENGPGRFDAQAPKHLPKINFLMLMRDEKLATLSAQFDADSHILTILRDGKQVARGALNTRIGRQMIEQFISAYMSDALRGPPRIVQAPGHSFSDVADKCVHIVNLASLRELERVSGQKLNPLRFRANVYLDGLEPWAEFGWLGSKIKIGHARLSVFKRTQRCAATNVDPDSAERDIDLPAALSRTWDHTDFGVYAKVESGGCARVGDQVASA